MSCQKRPQQEAAVRPERRSGPAVALVFHYGPVVNYTERRSGPAVALVTVVIAVVLVVVVVAGGSGSGSGSGRGSSGR